MKKLSCFSSSKRKHFAGTKVICYMMMLMLICEANELERGRTLAAAAAAAAYVIPRLPQGTSVHILSTKPFIFLVKIDVKLNTVL